MYKLIIFLVLFGVNSMNAQDTLRVNTSAQCESCKHRLETRMSKMKGVFSSNLNIESKVMTVVIDPKHTNLKSVEDKINEIGYAVSYTHLDVYKRQA